MALISSHTAKDCEVCAGHDSEIGLFTPGEHADEAYRSLAPLLPAKPRCRNPVEAGTETIRNEGYFTVSI